MPPSRIDALSKPKCRNTNHALAEVACGESSQITTWLSSPTPSALMCRRNCSASGIEDGSGLAVSRNSARRSEEHTSELQSLMRISYAVFCLKKKKKKIQY